MRWGRDSNSRSRQTRYLFSRQARSTTPAPHPLIVLAEETGLEPANPLRGHGLASRCHTIRRLLLSYVSCPIIPALASFLKPQ